MCFIVKIQEALSEEERRGVDVSSALLWGFIEKNHQLVFYPLHRTTKRLQENTLHFPAGFGPYPHKSTNIFFEDALLGIFDQQKKIILKGDQVFLYFHILS